MNWMNAAELASRGAALTSVFHQLFDGNRGRGREMGPPSVAADAAPQRRSIAAATIRRRSIVDSDGGATRAVVRFLTESAAEKGAPCAEPPRLPRNHLTLTGAMSV